MAQLAVVLATLAALGICVIALHAVEIWIFGATIWTLLQWPATGTLHGPPALGIVGFGNIAPVTWSASFTYLEMERFWRAEEMDSRNAE